MAAVTLQVLYPQPTDPLQFDRDYVEHLALLHLQTNIPIGQHPYTVTKFVAIGPVQPAYYQMFSLPFPSAEALQQAMFSPQMQAVAIDAARISSGGAPVVLVGAAVEL